MATIQEKCERLDKARKAAEQFVSAHGDMKSAEGIALGKELAYAAADVAQELGFDILTDRPKADFIRRDPASIPQGPRDV